MLEITNSENDETLRNADALVERWAVWSRTDETGVGWPKTSPSYRLARNHEVGVRPEPGAFIPARQSPEDVATCDRIIAKLPARLRAAIEWRYLDNRADEFKAKRMGISRRTFRRIVDAALLVISARLANA